MKYVRLLLAVMLVGTAATAVTPSWAHDHHRGHARFGVFIGAPLWPSWYYPPPFYYYPPVITVPAAPPPVYIEQPNPPATTAQAYWYYCGNPEGYYPYVKECPGGWQKVSPQP